MFQLALAFTPALFLTYLIRFDLFGLPTNILELYTGILFIWFLLKNLKHLKHLTVPTNPKIKTALLLFIIATTLALIITLTRLPGEFIKVPLGIWKGWVIAPIIMFIMMIGTFKTKKDLEFLISVFIYSAGIYALFACFEYFTDLLPGPARTYDNRLVWPYFDSATFQGSAFQKLTNNIRSHSGISKLFPSAPPTPSALSAPKLINSHPISSILSIPSVSQILPILLMAFAIFLTKSFAAWLAIIVTLTFGFFLQIRSKKKWFIPLISIIIIGIIGVTQIGTEKFQYALKTTGDSSTAERIRTYQTSIGMIQADPLFGTGLGQFQRQFETQAPEILDREITRKEINHALHAHNLFLMIYLSFGLFGFLAFLYLLYVLFTKNSFPYAIFLSMPLVYILVHGLFDVPYFKNDLAYEFWLLASFIAISKQIPHSIKVTIIKGMGLATKLGFPTVNLKFTNPTPLPHGVYCASISSKNETQHGVFGFGKRLTQDIDEETCEIHLLDSDGFSEPEGLLHLGPKIRNWKKFKNIYQLQKAIKSDIKKTRKLAKWSFV